MRRMCLSETREDEPTKELNIGCISSDAVWDRVGPRNAMNDVKKQEPCRRVLHHNPFACTQNDFMSSYAVIVMLEQNACTHAPQPHLQSRDKAA